MTDRRLRRPRTSPLNRTIRHATLLHDDLKGLIQALIVFEDGGTTITQSFPGAPATMRTNLRDAKRALIKKYELAPGQVRTKIAALDPLLHDRPAKSLPS